ncbi:hypothetical protein [Streptomyces sp. NPDC051098]|uniref:hypothetical protein n=1 Tax=Streptomyces sp. NPDC051098 TaxID=3155411 RepID=UPI00342A7FB7
MDDDVAGLTGGEPPAPSAMPPIRIRLHDGQELTGRLLYRWQGSTGTWFYRVSVTLWASARIGGRDLHESADVEFDVSQTHVTPIDGVSYRDVPLTRHRDAIVRGRTGRAQTSPRRRPQAERTGHAAEGGR